MTAPGSPLNKKAPRRTAGLLLKIMKRGEASVLGRPGSDLLSQVLRLSTIGAGEFNGRVRDGIGFGLPAKTTRPAKNRGRTTEDRGRKRVSVLCLQKSAQADLICPPSSDVCRPTTGTGNE